MGLRYGSESDQSELRCENKSDGYQRGLGDGNNNSDYQRSSVKNESDDLQGYECPENGCSDK